MTAADEITPEMRGRAGEVSRQLDMCTCEGCGVRNRSVREAYLRHFILRAGIEDRYLIKVICDKCIAPMLQTREKP